MTSTRKNLLSRRTIVTLLKVLASSLLIGLILQQVGLLSLLDALHQLETTRLVGVLTLSTLFLLARSWKWQIVARAEIPHLTYWASVNSLVGGMGLGMVTPARAGEFSRAMFLPEGDRVSLIGLFTVDRVLDLLAIIFYGAVGLALAGLGLPLAASAAVLAAGVGCLYGVGRAGGALQRVSQRLRGEKFASRFVGGIQKLSVARTTGTVLVSIFASGFGYLQFIVILDGFTEVPIAAAMFTFSAMILSNLLPISIGGIGVREWVSALLLPVFGVSEAIAVNAAFISYLTNTVLPGVVGALLLARSRPAANLAPKQAER